MGTALYGALRREELDVEELAAFGRAAGGDAAAVVVAYEEKEGVPHRDLAVARGRRVSSGPLCAPDACRTLETSSGNQAERPPSSSASSAASRRRPSVELKKPAKATVAEPQTADEHADKDEDALSTSATDNEDEDERCCAVHKLCMCEVRLHRSTESCWLVASGSVYDVTGILGCHPGGARCLLRKAGGPDCQQDMDFHTRKARRMLDKCFIGKLEPCGEGGDQSNCSIM